MKKAIIAIFVFTVLSGFLSPAFAEGEKIAYVDVAKVFDEYLRTKDNDRVLQEAGKKKEAERDTLVKEIRQFKDEMALLNSDAKVKKQEALEGKMKELQAFDQDARKSLGEQRNAVVREIFKDIDDAVQRYGERKGLDMIFNERALLYHSPKFDATKDLIDELNGAYAKKKR
jgi:Skp family chaperone for outer membrane proteins